MRRRPTRSTRTDTLFPYTTLFRSMPSMKRSVPLIFVLTVLTACAVSPTGRHQLRLVSDSEMSQMGVTAFQQMKEKTPATKNARPSAYVQCVAPAPTAQVPRPALTPANSEGQGLASRSEERRVGAECVSTRGYRGTAA